MHVEAVRTLLARQPFMPIEIETSSGETYKVNHPETIMQTPGGRTLVLGVKGESIVMLDVALIADIVTPSTKATKRPWRMSDGDGG